MQVNTFFVFALFYAFLIHMLQRIQNEKLLDDLLEGSGVNRAGDRLNVILFIRDSGEQNSPSPKGKSEWGWMGD